MLNFSLASHSPVIANLKNERRDPMRKQSCIAWACAPCFALLLLASNVAHAQYNYYTSSSFYFNQNNYPKIITDVTSDDDDSPKSKRSATPQPSKPAPVNKYRASADNNPLPYTRDKALSAKLREEFLQDFAKQMPISAAEMRDMTEKNDLVQVVAGMAQLQGLDSGTTEGLLALWYGQAWAVSHQKPLPTPEQYQGIANQLRRTMTKSPEWRNMNNAKLQTLFEQLAYPLFVQKANYQAYMKQGKTDSIVRMASATQTGLKKMGVDLESVQLSNRGFQR
jgi:hypothetical protein